MYALWSCCKISPLMEQAAAGGILRLSKVLSDFFCCLVVLLGCCTKYGAEVEK